MRYREWLWHNLDATRRAARRQQDGPANRLVDVELEERFDSYAVILTMAQLPRPWVGAQIQRP